MYSVSSPRSSGRFVLAAVLSVAFVSAAWAEAPARAKYVFLFIGDGMGVAQRSAAEWYASAMAGGDATSAHRPLQMNALPVTGLITTYSEDSTITDSAAAGTALATGHKTKNGVIAMDAAGEKSFGSVASAAKAAGFRVGIVTTDTIDGATPACFYAHEGGRGSYYKIAMQLAGSGFDYFAGIKPAGAAPKDGEGTTTPFDAAREAGYAIVDTIEAFAALKSGAGKVWVSDSNLPSEIDRRSELSLADLTRKGIELLGDEQGFFMMVEGARVDKACHVNDAATAVLEVLALDNAVEEALAFAKKHAGETLIVVTADHETGGMTLGSTGAAAKASYKALAGQRMSGWRYDGIVKKMREDKKTFDGALPSITENFGLSDLTDGERARLAAAYELSMNGLEGKRDDETYRLYSGGEPLTMACQHAVNLRAGIGFTSYGHTGTPLPVSAGGVGCERFTGYYDNTEIPKRIAGAMGIEIGTPAAATQKAPTTAPAPAASAR